MALVFWFRVNEAFKFACALQLPPDASPITAASMSGSATNERLRLAGPPLTVKVNVNPVTDWICDETTHQCRYSTGLPQCCGCWSADQAVRADSAVWITLSELEQVPVKPVSGPRNVSCRRARSTGCLCGPRGANPPGAFAAVRLASGSTALQLLLPEGAIVPPQCGGLGKLPKPHSASLVGEIEIESSHARRNAGPVIATTRSSTGSPDPHTQCVCLTADANRQSRGYSRCKAVCLKFIFDSISN